MSQYPYTQPSFPFPEENGRPTYSYPQQQPGPYAAPDPNYYPTYTYQDPSYPLPPASQYPHYPPGPAAPHAAPYAPSPHYPVAADPALQALSLAAGGASWGAPVGAGFPPPAAAEGFRAVESNTRPFPQHQQQQQQQFVKLHNQDYDSLRHHCLSRGELFVDPHFGISNDLLALGDEAAMSSSRSSRSRSSVIEWLRPHEICQRLRLSASPQMFVANFDRFDVNQGEIGNCWFLAALATLAEKSDLFQKIVPANQDFAAGSYAGIFRFRFWRFGEWVEIVIDDQLPTRRGELVYLRSNVKNEFWSALLEKAYAKMYGSYKALEGGLTIEAAVDFTGGIPELVDITQEVRRDGPERLFVTMATAWQRGAFLGCALSQISAREARMKGLLGKHAYTITKVVELRFDSHRSLPLIRIRNPHGNSREWNGDWGDNDPKWRQIPEQTKKTLGLTFNHDGEFYMAFTDFLKYFGDLEICHMAPEDVQGSAGKKKQFEMFSFYGQWRAGVSSGGCGNEGISQFAKNPQYFISLNDPDRYDGEDNCSVVVSLAQRQLHRKSVHAIGFKVYKCELETKTLSERHLKRNSEVARSDAFINLRETSKRLTLRQGRYCIVPSTFRVGEEADFLLRVFVEKSWGSTDHQAAVVTQQMFSKAGVEGLVSNSWDQGYGTQVNHGSSYSWANDQASYDEALNGLIHSLNIQAI